MIIIEDLNETFVRAYSDAGYYIRQVETGTQYVEAVDLKPCKYTYEETTEKYDE